MHRTNLFEFNLEDNINKILEGCWFLTNEVGVENGCVIAGWGWENVVRYLSA